MAFPLYTAMPPSRLSFGRHAYIDFSLVYAAISYR